MSGVGRAVSLLGRTTTRASALRQAIRSEVENAPGNNMPFQTKNKPRLLVSMAAFCGLAFSIPFIAVRFQMYKKSNA
eukprot:gene8088-8955_t